MSGISRIVDVARRMGFVKAPPGQVPVFASPSGTGLEIQDGSDTRSFLTAGMSGGVPTGNFM